jgi:hypothetical protein
LSLFFLLFILFFPSFFFKFEKTFHLLVSPWILLVGSKPFYLSQNFVVRYVHFSLFFSGCWMSLFIHVYWMTSTISDRRDREE